MRTLIATLLLAGLALAASVPSQAQIIVVNERYYITELRRDKNMIGVSMGRDFNTRTWVDLKPDTKFSTSIYRGAGRRDVTLSLNEAWGYLKPGMRIKVHGGRDWDQHVVAKKVWF